MASKLNVDALTLNPLEAQEVSEVVQEKVFVNTPLSLIHNIETGVQMKKQIVFLGNLEVGGEALSGCTPAEQDGLVMSQKYWEPALIAGRFTHCANDLNVLLKIFKKAQKVEPDFYDRIDSEELGILVAKITEALTTSIFAKVWLGDTAADDVTGGGNFTDSGFNEGIWNQFDGLFKQIFADSDVPVYTIDENSEATYAAQDLAEGASYSILKGMYDNADSRLLGDPDAQFLVTRSIWDNYLTYLESTQSNGGLTEVLDDGRKALAYRGIPVIQMNEWDRLIRKYQDTTAAHFRPHRAILTTPMNIPIGTLNEADLQNLESFYDKKDKTNIIDYGYYLDAKFLESYMASVAY